jgi:hypothetical protein
VTKSQVKLIHEGEYLAEVRIEVEQTNAPWGPYVNPDEARKLDALRLALRRNDIATAARYGTVYRLTKVAG